MSSDEGRGPVAFELTAEIEIDAPAETVWRSLTEDIGSWWPHSFSAEPKITLEAWVGGRFWEEFGDAAGGALYGLVTYLRPGAELTVSGAMGMRGARQYVKTYTLEASGSGTRVRTVASVLGDISDETRAGYEAGGVEVLERLKAFTETASG
ncbi:MAG: SRPBCC family protein [Kribbellaceae bacterium]